MRKLGKTVKDFMDTDEDYTSYTARVSGKNILVFGDLHFSSSFEGQHKSYIRECYDNMKRIKSICTEKKPCAVIFLGDLIGVNERTIRDRQFFTSVLQFFMYLNRLTGGNVFSVKGNHDMGDFTDFDCLVGLGMIRNPKYVDFYGVDDDGSESLEVRFHLVNYGYEEASLVLTGDEYTASNVVLGHADYYIDGVSNWYSAGKGVEVNRLGNFCGVQLIISGHIHIPSDEILYTTLKDGSLVGLFFTGSPSRAVERYDDCWYINFEYSVENGVGSTDCNPILMGLPKAEEIFYPKEDFEMSEEEKELKESSEKLTALVTEIIDSRLASGDIINQIRINPVADEETKNLAIEYYEKAERGE